MLLIRVSLCSVLGVVAFLALAILAENLSLLKGGLRRSDTLPNREPPVRRQIQTGGGSRNHNNAMETPTENLPPRTAGDAPWTQTEASYRSRVACPFGISNKPRGIVLLVPGTAGSPSEAYKSSPYYQGLPSHGFDFCWINIPNYSMGDMQLAAEYVAYGVKYLAPRSTATRGKINILSYSQGGANFQWVSTFWPSIRKFVQGHVALAPSMKGTLSTMLLCPLTNLAGGCLPSIIQQTANSAYMKAANSHRDTQSAAYAHVPTTIVYTLIDEIVTPQVGPQASSRLIGASVMSIQEICGPAHNPEHFTIIGDVGVYGIALDAFLNRRPARPSTVDRSYCTRTIESLGFQLGNLPNYLKFAYRTAIGEERGEMISEQLRTLRLPAEPFLQEYVCDRGYTNSRCTRNGFRDKRTTTFIGAELAAVGLGGARKR